MKSPSPPEPPRAEVPWTYSLFQQPWWLEAVAPGCWGEVLVSHEGEILGRMPYVTKERAGVRIITQPPLTPALGPWIADQPGKPATRLSAEKRIMGELITGLPRFSAFHQSFAPQVTNWLPFYWAGFEATVRYTYRLEDLTNLDAVWEGFTPARRRKIRRAADQLEVTTGADLDTLLDVTLGRLRRKGVKVGFDPLLVSRLDAACVARDARRMFFAVDKRDEVRAAVYIVWDDRSAYYLLGGSTSDESSGFALRLAMWEAIRFASTVSRAFDFEGSMIEPVERFFRGFGPRQLPYFHVRKVRGALRPLWALRGWRPRFDDRLSRR